MAGTKRLCIVDPSFTMDSPTMKHLVYAVPALIDAGWLVHVIAEKVEPDLPVEFQRIDRRIQLPMFEKFRVFNRVKKYVRDFRICHPDAIVFGTPGMPYGADVNAVHFLQHIWLRRSRTVPGMELRDRAWLLLARLDARRAAKEFHCARRPIWLAVSESIAEELRRIVARPEMVYVLPNSYDESRFNLGAVDRLRSRKRAELNFRAKDFIFAFLSQGHHRRKGFWVAIEALAHLRQEKPAYDPHFLVIGSTQGTLQRLKHTLSRQVHDWPEWIHFVGMAGHPEDYLAAADALLLPSYFEAFCLAEIEAAALGLPLLLTPHYGTEMILEHFRNGLTIDWDPPVLSKQLFEFLSGTSPLGELDPVTLRPRNFKTSVGRALNRSQYGSALLEFLEAAYERRTGMLKADFA
jgi:glycosyltransferase involved in cell wall biosynthesis